MKEQSVDENQTAKLTPNMADSSNSKSDEEENTPRLKRAATKKRHFTCPIGEIKPCSIYSAAADSIALPDMNANLPDSDVDDEDCHVQPINKKKRNVRKRNARTKKPSRVMYLDSDDEDISCYGTPKKTTHIVSVDSPCSPPPPLDPAVAIQRPLVHDKETSLVLRNINIALTNVRCIQSEVSSQSDDAFSPMARTPGGSISAIDVDAPLPARIRNSITVKVRSRSGIHRFPLQMCDTFIQVIDDIAGQEGVKRECVKLARDGQDINELDTPRTINLHIADIIDCLIVEPGSLITETIPDQTVEVTIQGKEKKSVMTRTILRTDSLQRLMEEYSAFCGQPMKRLKFTFDGDIVNATDTPISLDFEEDANTIDVMHVKTWTSVGRNRANNSLFQKR